MSQAAATFPTRRSALQGVHEQLGARWIAPDLAWPASYGATATELAATRTGVALAELGPVDKLMIRGAGTADALNGLGVTPAPRTVTEAGGLDVWVLGMDEALVLLDTAIPGIEPLSSIAERAGVTGATVVDVSSGSTVLRLVGPRARRVLASLAPVDVSDAALLRGRIVATPMAGIRVSIGRLDQDDSPGFTLLVDRDAATYLWSALMEIGAGHGIVPVGGPAARPARGITGGVEVAP